MNPELTQNLKQCHMYNSLTLVSFQQTNGQLSEHKHQGQADTGPYDKPNFKPILFNFCYPNKNVNKF